MTELPIPPEVVEAAAKAAHERLRDLNCSAGATVYPTWQGRIDDPACWGGENFTLEQVLGCSEVAIRAADEARGMRVERKRLYSVEAQPNSFRYRYVSRWFPVEEE